MMGKAKLRRSIRLVFRRRFANGRTGVVLEQDRTSSVEQCPFLLTQFLVHFVDFHTI